MTRPRTSGSHQERAFLAALATFSGAAIRKIGMGLPGVMGPALVVVGLALIWPPIAVIASGLILWAIDRRIP